MTAVLVLSACGGGSGGPSTGTGGGGTAATTTNVSGTFVDNAVNGLDYTGSPSGTTGVTGDNGTQGGFTVVQGDTVTFRIGSLLLGTSEAVTSNGGVITPAELAGDKTNFNDPKAVRIAQIIQSLDSDGDTSNGITISDAVKARLGDGTVNVAALQAALDGGTDFDTVFTGQISALTAGARTTIVSASQAKAELAAAVAQATGGSVGVIGGTPIVAAATASCPVGVAATSKVDIFGQDFPVCVISNRITSSVTLTNDHVYLLQAAINVGTGDAQGAGGAAEVVLTVEPGTQIYGYNGLQTGLIITRGSRIEAVGTANRPIIMAAVEATGSGTAAQITDDPTDLTKRGQWAGLVLSGRGINNDCVAGEIQTEAAPTGTQRFFGCNDNTDSSGTVKYVIIGESGLGFRPNQEVQGLTIEAAGSGTVIDWLQVLGSEDDGIEWFGGAANASNIVINGQDDDGLDMDEGYVGTVQRALVITGATNGNFGIEADTAGPNDDAIPVSRPNFVNLTILGNTGGGNTTGALFKDGFGGEIFRGALLDYPSAPSGGRQFTNGCFDIDDQVDQNTAFRDVAVSCANAAGNFGAVSDGDGFEDAIANGGNDETAAAIGADRRDFTTITAATALNATTLAVTVAEAPNNAEPLPASVNGLTAGNYFGAVDPAAAAPDFDPTNNENGGGPFWDGWTYINAAVDGGLPGDNFHPLEAEIRVQTAVEVNGTLIDAEVNGVDYQASGGSRSGVTGASGVPGQFTVNAGDTVTFRIGSLILGTSNPIQAGDIVTPAELAGAETDPTNALAIRIARILQSLDSDNNTANGISIDAAVATRLTDGTVDTGALQTAMDTGTNFVTVFGGMIDELTAGNANRAEGDIVSSAQAQTELAAAVAMDISGSSGSAVGASIVPAVVGDCPVGVLATAKVAIFGQQFPVCVLSQDILTNVKLTNDHIYVLQAAIKVGDGDAQGGPSGANNATLTIDPGTQIFGYNGLQTGLIITRGSKINALGTADLPIIMAAVEATGTGTAVTITDDPANLSKRGQWAGLVLSGFGINNDCTAGEIQTEAAPTGTQRYFGCNNNADSSGTVQFVIIAESGLGFRPNQEVQGLTIEAAGSGTVINWLQVLGSEDDGIEWFGGAANASNIVINGQDDDALDMDEGYVGNVQRALVVTGATNGNFGIEADTAGPNDDAIPVSRPNFLNLTILGNAGGGNTVGALFKDGFGGEIFRGAILDFAGAPAGSGQFTGGCYNIDDQIDQNTAFRDVAVGCANGTTATGADNADMDGFATTFDAGGNDETMTPVAADRRDFTIITPGTALNTTTLAVTVGEAPNNPEALPTAVNNTAVGNFFGAVDPASGNPDGNPNNNGAGGGPFWDGWTYIRSDVDGKLPGADFHPLEAEITP